MNGRRRLICNAITELLRRKGRSQLQATAQTLLSIEKDSLFLLRNYSLYEDPLDC